MLGFLGIIELMCLCWEESLKVDVLLSDCLFSLHNLSFCLSFGIQ